MAGPARYHCSIMAWMGVTKCVLGASAAIAARSGKITRRDCPTASAASRSFPAKLTTVGRAVPTLCANCYPCDSAVSARSEYCCNQR